MGRVMEARAALPKILNEDKNLAMVFGSSMVGAAFSPRQFDSAAKDAGKNIKSFNFGFGGLNPFFQDQLSRGIAEEFKNNDRRLKLAVIEFNPFQATQARWNGAKGVVDSFTTILASEQHLWDITLDDPIRGIRLFNIKHLRGNISSEMITSRFGRVFFSGKQLQRLSESNELVKLRRELSQESYTLFHEDFPNYQPTRWSYHWQGGGTIPQERSERSIEVILAINKTKQNDAYMGNKRQNRIRRADIEGLNFEPLLVESFIRIVENFKQFSDKVEVVMLPRNTRWIHYSPEARARLDTAINQIEQATGVTIKDHQDLTEINPDMFRDSTHLARYSGDVAYTDYLVKLYAKNL